MGACLVLGIVGKLGEEANEVAKVCNRITIQGLDGIDPSSGLPNRYELEKEIADVEHMIEFAKKELGLDRQSIDLRSAKKTVFHVPWIEYLRGLVRKDR